MYKIQWYSWSNGRQRLELLANRVGSWANMVEKDLIKKSPHSSVYEECERLVNETLLVNLFLLFANSFLFEPPSYSCPQFCFFSTIRNPKSTICPGYLFLLGTPP